MSWDFLKYFDENSTLGKLGAFASSDAGKGLTNLAGLGLTGYGMYKQNKLLDKQNDLLEQTYKYNKSLTDRQIAQQNLEQENINNAFSDVFGTNSKKKKLGDYTGTYNYSA